MKAHLGLSIIRGNVLDEKEFKIAFTLIELLVVISIIAVLVALILPALSHAKTLANLSKCKSNLHQLELYLRIYVDDNSAYPTNWSKWRLGDPQQSRLFCPPKDRMYRGNYGVNELGYWGDHTSNPRIPSFGLGPSILNDGTLRTTKDTEVRVPSDMIALGDDLGVGVITGSLKEFVLHVNDGEISRMICNYIGETTHLNPEIKDAAVRHKQRANVAFCDGRVETLTFKSLFYDKDDNSLQRWNKDHLPHKGFK